MKKPCFLFLAVMFGIGLASGGIPSVFAQESASEGFILEEIVVTAQKRPENLQKVPIHMEVISGEDLLGTGKDNVDDILRDVSSVLINKSEDGMRITLRGLADDAPLWFDMQASTPTVAVNIDGAYNSSSSAGQNLFDIERVEVLSGPQSTLYGSNSPGGIVNVVTASPKTDKFSANVSTEFGNYGLFDGQAMVNAPIIKDLMAIRIAAQAFKRDSWIVGGNNRQDTKTVRLKTLIQPSDTFSAGLTLNYSEAVSGGRLGGSVRVFDYEDGHYEDGTPVTNPWTAPVQEPSGRGTIYKNLADANERDLETKGIQAEVNWETAIGSISFIPYYNEQDSDDVRNDVEVWVSGETEPDYTTQNSLRSEEQKGADLRIASPDDFFFEWIFGVTYYETTKELSRDDLFYDVNDRDNSTEQTNKAVYGNITYPFTDKIRGTAGMRYSWDEINHVEISYRNVDPIVTGQDYSEPDYKVGMEYDMSDNSMLYASFATSYRVNALAISQGQATVPPEELKAYSVGAKNRFFGNKLQLNASVFYYDYQNKNFAGSNDGRFKRGGIVYRESDFPHDGEPGTDFNGDGDYNDTTLPVGSPKLRPGETSDLVGLLLIDPWQQQFGTFESIGVDLSVDWVITSADRLSLSVSYLDATWTDATVRFYWPWIWDDEGKSYDGKRATYSSEWSAHGSYQHIFNMGSIGTLTPKIDVQYKSDYFLDFAPEEYPYNYQEPYFIWNGSVTFIHSSGRWSVNAYIKNATEYAAKTFWQKPSTIAKLGISDPKTYGAVLSLRF